MTRGRMEAFSDAVIAIVMTIMVLELRAPISAQLEALGAVWPGFLCYALSFTFLGIYWNNHHHMLHSAHHISGRVLWANMHLLFWLSMIPFVTAWMAEHFARGPVLTYGGVLLLCAIAYYILARTLVAANGKDSAISKSLGADFKGKISILIYAASMGIAWLMPSLACALYVLVALMWLVPDRRFEHVHADPTA
ncbi:MAG: DUF1211 domain-containing protein [Fimbriimonadaceae bacterium]|nr:DUF1211 domain-containing protein [Fimbriimonadaceae bacterium]